MSVVFPNNNLPTSSQPWAREVQKQLSNIILSDSADAVNNAARDNQLNSSIIALTGVINGVKAVTDGLTSLGDTGSLYNINADNITAGTINASTITITNLDADNITAGSISGDIISGGTITGVTINTQASGQRVELTNTRAEFYDSSNDLTGYIVGTGNILYMTNAGTGAVSITSTGVTVSGPFVGASSIASTTSMRSGGTLGRIELDDGPSGSTTGASINSAGNLIRTPSSARYKEDIKDANFKYEDILLLRPRTFKLKSEIYGNVEDGQQRNPNPKIYAGFIAEEIAGTPLDIFVSYKNLESGEKAPDGVYYAELTAALTIAIKHQDQLIKSLTNRIETLENGA